MDRERRIETTLAIIALSVSAVAAAALHPGIEGRWEAATEISDAALEVQIDLEPPDARWGVTIDGRFLVHHGRVIDGIITLVAFLPHRDSGG